MTRDITHCIGYTEREEPCPIRMKCGRYVQRLSLPDLIAHWTMYAPGCYEGEPPEWVCEYFIVGDEYKRKEV